MARSHLRRLAFGWRDSWAYQPRLSSFCAFGAWEAHSRKIPPRFKIASEILMRRRRKRKLQLLP